MKVVSHYVAKGKIQAQAEELATNEDKYINTFFVPERERWDYSKHLKHNIGVELNKVTEVSRGKTLP